MSRSAHGAQLARLLRRLVDDGAVDPGAALDGRVTVTDLSRSNPVGLVHVDGCPEVVVKGGTISGDGIDPIRGELAAYRWLSASPDTARLAPVPLLEVAGEMAVVTRPLVGAVSLHEALGSGTSTSEALIAELGRILGVLHSARAGLRDLPARRPWILDVPAGRMPTIAVGNDPAGRLTEAIAQCAPVAAAITRMARAWTSRTMIHGDIKFDNVLVAHDRMLLVDWELAGLGAPVWDLAGVVDGLLIPSCVSGHDEAVDITLVARLAEPALTAHRRVAGAELSPALEELAVAVVTRLAQTATQLAAMGHDRPDAAEAAPLVLAGAIELASGLVSDPRLVGECT
jgi:Ser/Thr protein kinase RdoA (MazF antagonist)